MLSFCYTKLYIVPVENHKQCLYHAQMYTIGDKYGIKSLQSAAYLGLRKKLLAYDGSPVYPTALPPKKQMILGDVLAAISHIYQNTQEKDSIRNMVARTSWDSAVLQKHRIDWTSFPGLNPDYACDMTLYSSEKLARYERYTEDFVEYQCSACGEGHIINMKAAESEKELTCFRCGTMRPSASWVIEPPGEQPHTRSHDLALV